MGGIAYNPFANRGMILKRNEFVGRQREISDILSRISNRNSASVVGERRVGKSSLLYHIYLTGNESLDDNETKRFRFIYMDFLDPKLSSPTNFSQAVLEKIDLHPGMNNLGSKPMVKLACKLDDYRKTNILPILLLDEFEQISKKRDLFNDEFFEGLRSFCSSGLMTIVTSSQHSLKELTDKGGLTSPFWNILAKIPLGEFRVEDDLNESALFLTHFWKGELKPTKEEKQFLISYASAHPLVMQVVSYHVLRNRELKFDERVLLEEIQKEISSYFRTRKEKAIRWLRTNTPIAVERIDWTTEWLGKQLRYFFQLRSLIS